MKVLTLIVVLLITVLFTGVNATTCELTEEAEFGVTNGNKILRSKASNKITVRLDENQYVLWPIVLYSFCFLRIMDVVYTNDGKSDIITVRVNDQDFGSFVTRSRSNHGYLWNQPVSSGKLENVTLLSAGGHTVKLVATAVDKYGIEIDKAVLGLECKDELCPKSTQENPLDNNNIIVIFFGIFSAVVTVFLFILGKYCCTKYKRRRSYEQLHDDL